MFPFIPRVYMLFVVDNTLRISWGKCPYRCCSLYVCTKIKQAAIGHLNKTSCSAVPVNVLPLPRSISYFCLIFHLTSEVAAADSGHGRCLGGLGRCSIKPLLEMMSVSQNTYSAYTVYAIGKFLEVNKCTLRT